MSEEARALGEAIRAARMARGLTQERLAELLDITPIHLKNIEGSRRKPSVPLLFQIMALLDLSVDELVFPDRRDPHRRADGGGDGGGAPPGGAAAAEGAGLTAGPPVPPSPLDNGPSMHYNVIKHTRKGTVTI